VLVVTRKRGESIVVGDGIEIHVVSVGRNDVRIGVTAPRDVTVHRREVYDLVMAANRTAAGGGVAAVAALASSLRQRVPRIPAAATPETSDAPHSLA
jgi:carbon storage regulator